MTPSPIRKVLSTFRRHRVRALLMASGVAVGYYATSVSLSESDEGRLEQIIRGHWSAIENGTHYRRDVPLGEDACRTADRQGAAVLATLRNLTNGLYELERSEAIRRSTR